MILLGDVTHKICSMAVNAMAFGVNAIGGTYNGVCVAIIPSSTESKQSYAAVHKCVQNTLFSLLTRCTLCACDTCEFCTCLSSLKETPVLQNFLGRSTKNLPWDGALGDNHGG